MTPLDELLAKIKDVGKNRVAFFKSATEFFEAYRGLNADRKKAKSLAQAAEQQRRLQQSPKPQPKPDQQGEGFSPQVLIKGLFSWGTKSTEPQPSPEPQNVSAPQPARKLPVQIWIK